MLASGLEIGLLGSASIVVGPAETAAAVGNDAEIRVLSTAHALILAEDACLAAVKPHLDTRQRLVGAVVHFHHLAPSPIGSRVQAQAVLREIDGSRLHFAITIRDEVEQIAKAEIVSIVVDLERFLARVARKETRRDSVDDTVKSAGRSVPNDVEVEQPDGASHSVEGIPS